MPHSWTFGEWVGMVTKAQSRKATEEHWLLTTDGKILLEATPVAELFDGLDFRQVGVEHPASHWAQLAMCAARAHNQTLVTASFMGGVGGSFDSDELAAPSVEPVGGGLMLRYWTFRHYRSSFSFQRHELVAAGKDAGTYVESDTVVFPRR